MLPRTVVLFGGASNERLVSVASAQNVCGAMAEAEAWFLSANGALHRVETAELRKHQSPFEVPFAPTAPARFASLEAAVTQGAFADAAVFLALHGGEGENGTLQALLERHHIPFTGSGSVASALAFDKAEAKARVATRGALLADAELIAPSTVDVLVTKLSALLQRRPRWVLKPVADGSSFGLVHLRDASQVRAAAAQLANVGVRYLAEEFIDGRELTVGVADFVEGTRALPVSEVRLKPDAAFDYAGKYLGRGTEELTPAPLSEPERLAAQALGVLAHQAVGCFGYSRTDMILTARGPVFLEINTLPGLTKASFIPQQLAAEGRDFREFLRRQLQLARTRTTPPAR